MTSMATGGRALHRSEWISRSAACELHAARLALDSREEVTRPEHAEDHDQA